MTNFGAKILNTAISSVRAQQGVLAELANNIANVNTPGYSRRAVLLENQSTGDGKTGLNIGSGVKIKDIIRFVDEFTNKNLRQAIFDQNAASTKNNLVSRIEDVFDLTGSVQTIGSTLTDFVSALNDLTANPSSIELRSNVIQQAQNLINTIKTAFGTMSDLQREIDGRLGTEVDSINNITSQVAQLNQQIAARENSGNLAADERDRRDYLLEELSKKISFSTIERSDGMVNVTLAGGLDIVFGANSRDLEVTTSPSFAGLTSPASLWGGVPAYIVYDYGSGGTPAHVNLTDDIAAGGGTLGGLLQVRGTYDPTDTSPFAGQGIIPEAASRIEAITRFLLTTFNTSYLGADEDSGTAGLQSSAGDLNGNPPSVYGFFDFAFTGVKDADGNGIPDDIGNHAGITSYSSLLQLTTSDPNEIAASLDLDATQGLTSFAVGDSSNITNLLSLLNSNSTFTVDNFSFTGTVQQVYSNAVSYVGNEKSKAALQQSVSDSNYKLAADRRDEISAVSLDEEVSQLTRFQKAYEASAKMIRIADELLSQILNLI